MIRKRVSPADRRRWLVAIPVMMLITVVAFAALWATTHNRLFERTPVPGFLGSLQEFQPLASPRPAPEVAFGDEEGKKLTLADFRGRLVVLNFWATWCAPCVEEMPSLDRLQAKVGSDVAIAAVSVDREGLPIVQPFLEKLGVKNLETYIDRTGASMRAFTVRGLPTTILIGRDGQELGRIEGMARWDTPAAETFIAYYAKPAS